MKKQKQKQTQTQNQTQTEEGRRRKKRIAMLACRCPSKANGITRDQAEKEGDSVNFMRDCMCTNDEACPGGVCCVNKGEENELGICHKPGSCGWDREEPHYASERSTQHLVYRKQTC